MLREGTKGKMCDHALTRHSMCTTLSSSLKGTCRYVTRAGKTLANPAGYTMCPKSHTPRRRQFGAQASSFPSHCLGRWQCFLLEEGWVGGPPVGQKEKHFPPHEHRGGQTSASSFSNSGSQGWVPNFYHTLIHGTELSELSFTSKSKSLTDL